MPMRRALCLDDMFLTTVTTAAQQIFTMNKAKRAAIEAFEKRKETRENFADIILSRSQLAASNVF
jgi:hypothetical protein